MLRGKSVRVLRSFEQVVGPTRGCGEVSGHHVQPGTVCGHPRYHMSMPAARRKLLGQRDFGAGALRITARPHHLRQDHMPGDFSQRIDRLPGEVHPFANTALGFVQAVLLGQQFTETDQRLARERQHLAAATARPIQGVVEDPFRLMQAALAHQHLAETKGGGQRQHRERWVRGWPLPHRQSQALAIRRLSRLDVAVETIGVAESM